MKLPCEVPPKFKPAGRMFVTVTLFALAGPLFATLILSDSGTPGKNEPDGGAMVIPMSEAEFTGLMEERFRVHPPMLPASPGELSKTYKAQSPFGTLALKLESVVPVVELGAGLGKGRPKPSSVGLNVPETIVSVPTELVPNVLDSGRLVDAVSSKVSVTLVME